MGPQYQIVLLDGSRFGPVTLAQLQEWAAEGGILPTAKLEQLPGGEELRAGDLEQLQFPPSAYKKLSLMAREAKRGVELDAQNLRSAWLMVALGPIVCAFGMCVPWGLLATPILPLTGLAYAKKLPPEKHAQARAIQLCAWGELLGALAIIIAFIAILASGVEIG